MRIGPPPKDREEEAEQEFRGFCFLLVIGLVFAIGIIVILNNFF